MKKQYNPVAAERLRACRRLKNTAICQLPNNLCEVIDLVQGCIKSGTSQSIKQLAYDMGAHEYDWHVLLLVFYRTPEGVEGFHDAWIPTPRRCYAKALEDSVFEKHTQLISEVDPDQFLCAGWIASPHPTDFEPRLMDKLFTGLGVWSDYITRLEKPEI